MSLTCVLIHFYTGQIMTTSFTLRQAHVRRDSNVNIISAALEGMFTFLSATAKQGPQGREGRMQ